MLQQQERFGEKHALQRRRLTNIGTGSSPASVCLMLPCHLFNKNDFRTQMIGDGGIMMILGSLIRGLSLSPCNSAAVRLSKARDQGQECSSKNDQDPVQIDNAHSGDRCFVVVRRSPCPESKPHEQNRASMVGHTYQPPNVEN